MLLPHSLSKKFDGILDSITLMPLTARTMAAEPRLTPCRNSATQSPGPSRPQQGCTTRRPANQQVRGRLTLKASDDHCKAVRTVCSIRHGVLTVSIESSKAVVAEVPVDELAVGLSRWRTDMFTIATLHNNRMYDEIYCFVDDQVKRNKWIAVFRRMDIPVFDTTA